MISRRLCRPHLFATLIVALCMLAPARAQQTDVPSSPSAKDDEEVVRISTELVQIDVMVFDGSGKFVDGLKPEQFELRVDGKPQQVVFFERIKAGTVNEDAQIAAARGGASAALAGGAAVPLDRGRTVVFFVDDLHLSPTSALQIRKTIQRFIDEEIGQNDEAVVVSASGQIGFLSQLTDNKAVLRAAAGRINTRPYTVRDGQSPTMTELQASAIDHSDLSVQEYFVEQVLRENPFLRRETAESQVQSRARNILQQSNAVAMNTLHTLASVVRGYAPLPGRKVLFFVSDGFLVDDSNSALRDRMRTISDAAARAGVVIYSLDAQGLRSGQADASEPGNFDPSGRLARTTTGEVAAMQAPLFTLAADTGGRALVNTNALGRVVSGALKETSLYYLLAWRPDAANGNSSPKYQRIEVAVRERPELRVLVRRGFYSGAQPPEALRAEKKRKGDRKEDAAGGSAPSAAERELMSALHAPLPRVALPTSLAIGYVYGDTEGSLLTVSVELERSALTYIQGEQKRADFDVIGAVLDDRGKPVKQFGQRLSVTPSPLIPESQQHIVYSFRFPLAPGLYQVRAATRDVNSGRTGSAMFWVELPELKKQFAMSSIFLGERTAGQQEPQLKAEDLPRSVLLSVDRRFARTSHIRFLTFVYNSALGSAGSPDVALQVQIFRDDQPVFTAPLSKLRADQGDNFARLPYMAELGLTTFPPGRYVLQLTAIDRVAKTSTSQRARFVVE